MAKHQVDDIRNIAVCGHGSSGKTTLVDRLLTDTKTVSQLASVDDGTSICDFDEEEKHHKYTIEASLTFFDHDGKHFNVIDTPGYPDFVGQMISSLRAVDTAAIVIDAHGGIRANTRRAFAESQKAGIGKIIVINKLDTENIDFPRLITDIQELWGGACLPFNIPLGSGGDFRGVVSALKVPDDTEGALLDPTEQNEKLIEAIIEVDDKVTERYFEGKLPTDEELQRLIPQAVQAGSLIPVICCSAKTGVGIPELIAAWGICALPPSAIERTARKDGETVKLDAAADGPLVAQVFRTRIDPFVQKLSFIRIYSGTLRKDDSIAVSGSRRGLKVSQLYCVQANETTPVDSAGPGDLVALAKADELHTGMTLGDYQMPPIAFPRPMVGLAVTPKSRGDEAKLSSALHKMLEEDSTFHLDRDAQTKELVITGMSELHLQLVQERLKRREKVEIETKEPKIPYRETIQGTAEGSYRHKKQSGGRGQFGEVHIRMYPLPQDVDVEAFVGDKSRFPSARAHHYDPDHNFLWVDSVVGGTIPTNFMPAIEKGFKERLVKGVIAGFRIQNVCIEVYFGKHHPVDSSEAAFKTAGSMVFRKVFQEAKPGLLEPIVTLEVTVPADTVGDINSDLSGRRGRVLGMDSAGGNMQTVTAEVPLAEVTTYARAVSSMSAGQGSYTIDFNRYDVVPGNVLKEIVDAAQHKEEEEV